MDNDLRDSVAHIMSCTQKHAIYLACVPLAPPGGAKPVHPLESCGEGLEHPLVFARLSS